MKWIFLLSGIIIFSSCNLRQREVELNKKLNELSLREQELALKEQKLSIKEQKLSEQQKILDSTTNKVNDSLLREHKKNIQGSWRVDMKCSETNCPGSAVGDVKTELWNIKFEENEVIVNARSNRHLVKIYSGYFVGNLLKLSADLDSAEVNAIINVRLEKTANNEMEGEREVTQANGCQILYTLRLKKE